MAVLLSKSLYIPKSTDELSLLVQPKIEFVVLVYFDPKNTALSKKLGFSHFLSQSAFESGRYNVQKLQLTFPNI